jgi:hypothetical protein
MTRDSDRPHRQPVSGTIQYRRVTATAVDEARLIVASGELALRHAAEIAHTAQEEKSAAVFAPPPRPAPLKVELLSYAVSASVAAIVIAAVLFVAGSRGGVVPLLH